MSRQTYTFSPLPSPSLSFSNPLAYLAYLGHWRGQLVVSLFVVVVCGIVFAFQGPVGRWRIRRKEGLAKRRQFEILSMEAEKKRQGQTQGQSVANGQNQGQGKLAADKKGLEREKERDKDVDVGGKKGKKEKKKGHGPAKSIEGLSELSSAVGGGSQTPQQRGRALSKGEKSVPSASAARKLSSIRADTDRPSVSDLTPLEQAESSAKDLKQTTARARTPSVLVTEVDVDSSSHSSLRQTGAISTPEFSAVYLPGSPSSTNLSALGEESASVTSSNEVTAAGPSRRSSAVDNGFSIIPERGYLPASTEALLNGNGVPSGTGKKKRSKSRTDGAPPSTPPPLDDTLAADLVSPLSAGPSRLVNGKSSPPRVNATGVGHARKQSYSGQGARSMADLDELLAGSEDRIDRLRAEVGAAKAEEAKAKTELREIKDGLFAGSVPSPFGPGAGTGAEEREGSGGAATLLAQRYRALRSDYSDVYSHISTLETIIRAAGLPVPMRTHLPDPAAHTNLSQRKHSLPPRSPLGLGGDAYALDRQGSTGSGPAAVALPPATSASPGPSVGQSLGNGMPGPSRRHSHAYSARNPNGFLSPSHPTSPFLSPGMTGPYLSAFPHASPLLPAFPHAHAPQHSPMPMHPSQLQLHLAAASAAGMGYPYGSPNHRQAYRSPSGSLSPYYPSPMQGQGQGHHFAGPLTPGIGTGTSSPMPMSAPEEYAANQPQQHAYEPGASDIFNVPGLPIGSAHRSRSVSDLRGRSAAQEDGLGQSDPDGTDRGWAAKPVGSMDENRRASIESSVLKKKPQTSSTLEPAAEGEAEHEHELGGDAKEQAAGVDAGDEGGLGIGNLEGVRSGFTGPVIITGFEPSALNAEDLTLTSGQRGGLPIAAQPSFRSDGDPPDADTEEAEGSLTSSSHPTSPSPNKTHRLLTPPNPAESLFADAAALKVDAKEEGVGGGGDSSDDTLPAEAEVDAERKMGPEDRDVTVRLKGPEGQRPPIFASLSNTTEQNLGSGR